VRSFANAKSGRSFMSSIRIVCATFALGLAATAAHAASVGLDVKAGLREMVSSGEASGAPPIPSLPAEALAHLTPAQRTQIRGAMAAGMKKAGKRRVTKQCVTADTLRRGIKLDEGKNTSDCKETLVSNAASVMEIRLQCGGATRGTGTYRFEAVSREQVHGTMNMTVSNGSDTMTIKRVMTGRWLGPDCGNVKPK
jgi:hypothetical protein